MLCPTQIAALAAEHRREKLRRETAPRIAEGRGRLDALRSGLSAAAEALGDLRPLELDLVYLARTEAALLLAKLDRLAAQVSGAVADLDARGGTRGGARRLPDLYEAPARDQLAARVADLLEQRPGHPLGTAVAGALLDALTAVVLEAGTGDAGGLEHVVRRELARRRNRAGSVALSGAP